MVEQRISKKMAETIQKIKTMKEQGNELVWKDGEVTGIKFGNPTFSTHFLLSLSEAVEELLNFIKLFEITEEDING